MAKPVLAIVGETGSGKSALAIHIAKQWGGEIICADAWTVRKGMDVGAAKPSAKDRSEIPHHLLDLVNPNESFNVAQFQERANIAIRDIHKRDKLPILVGGNGLYIDSVLYDYSFLVTDHKLNRDKINKLDNQQILNILEDQGVNTVNIDKANKRRLVRLLETKGKKASKHNLRENTLIIGLRTERSILKSNLEIRLDEMIASGLEEEVKRLSDNFGWQIEALKGVGYKQWRDYFSGLISLVDVKEQIIRDSLNLAKKQRTWFKRNQDIIWVDTPVNWHDIVDIMTTFLNHQV